MVQNERAYIDTTGAEVLPFVYDEAANFWAGWARVKMDGKWGIINVKGEEIVPFGMYDGIGFYGTTEGIIEVEKDDLCGMIQLF